MHRLGKTWLVWLLFFNWPFFVGLIPPLRAIVFFPLLFWINIPSMWLGLGKAVGEPHFKVDGFGVLPVTAWGWGALFAFWTGVAVLLTLLTLAFPELMYRRREEPVGSGGTGPGAPG